VHCTTPKADAAIIPFAQGFQDATVFAAYRALEAAQHDLALAIPLLALPVAQGSTVANVAVPLNLATAPQPSDVTVSTTAAGLTIAVNAVTTVADIVTLIVTISATATAPLGDCGVTVAVAGMSGSSQPALGLLTVVAASAAPAPQRLARAGGRA
jgi:hypothetical protein